MRAWLSLLLVSCVTEPEPVLWCEDATRHQYEPYTASEVEQWPDDVWTRDDPTSRTGLRLAVSGYPWTEQINEAFKPVVPDMEMASGFHAQGQILMSFTKPLGDVPTGSAASMQSDALQLLDLSTSPPTRIPYEVSFGGDGHLLFVLPQRPLRLGTRHALVVTTELTAEDGGCISPSPLLRSFLDGSSDDPRLVERYANLLAETELDPSQISAATVWTTHSDQQPFLDAAAAVRDASYGWQDRAGCELEEDERWLECEGIFEASDFRGSEGNIADSLPTGSWSLVVTTLLPPTGEGPFPTILYGHGLNSDRMGSSLVMSQLVDLGVAVVSVDAMHHGDHPTADPDATLDALPFLGINFDEFTMDGLVLVGSFDQTTLDRLQLLELIAQDPDVDGDGRADLDVSQMAYVGISLGGMLGPALLANTEVLQGGVLWVGGGHLINFALDSADIEPYRPLLELMAGGEDSLLRLLPVAQTLVDSADPAVWGARIFSMPAGVSPPDILLPVALEDTTVPPSCARALARSMALEHVKPVATQVDGLLTTTAPSSANHPSGASAAYFQYDRVSEGLGVTRATHGNLPGSPEGEAQIRQWVGSWLSGEASVVIDPYEALGTPALP